MPARFFCPGSWKQADILQLDSEQSHHAARVLRLEEGSAVELFNGEGLLGLAELQSNSRGKVSVRLNQVSQSPNPWKITLAFSLGKPPVTEFILKRVTELGIRRFQPLKTKFSHPGDFKSERWKKILLEVCKQCQETHVPELAPLMELDEWMRSWGPRPILLCDEMDRGAVASSLSPSGEVAVLVGAEGGWDRAEVQMLSQSALHLGLGRNRLRAETAALTATVVVKRLLHEIP